MEDYAAWSTRDLIDSLERDEAEDVFESEVDPDGPFRYTGEFDGWWSGLRMIAQYGGEDEKRIRAAIIEIRASE